MSRKNELHWIFNCYLPYQESPEEIKPSHHCTEGFYQEDTASEQSKCTPGLGKCKTAHRFHYLKTKKTRTTLAVKIHDNMQWKLLRCPLRSLKSSGMLSMARSSSLVWGKPTHSLDFVLCSSCFLNGTVLWWNNALASLIQTRRFFFNSHQA